MLCYATANELNDSFPLYPSSCKDAVTRQLRVNTVINISSLLNGDVYSNFTALHHRSTMHNLDNCE
jgi:hypothetical protein